MHDGNYFRGKKITVLGLGLLGRGAGDAQFLARSGAELIVTDLKNEEHLAPSLKRLKKFNNISYTLGRHDLKDFRDRDFILKAAGVPLDSPYIAEAKKHGVPIEMSASLCARLSGATIIGVTGTRGKSTTTHLLYHILKSAGKRVHLGGNVRGVSTLALLPKIKEGDYLVLELDSWQLQGFGEAGISPHIAVFTNFLSDHLNYYQGDEKRYFEDKANIFKYQTEEDVLIAGKQVIRYIVQLGFRSKIKSSLIEGRPLPKSWKIKLLGEHNRENAALAVETARACGISERQIRKAVEPFKGVPGRLELVRTLRGIKVYNDTTATTPDATIAALKTLSPNDGLRKSIILIMGGADKGLNITPLLKVLPKTCKVVFLLAGTGTEKIMRAIAEKEGPFDTLKKALTEALACAKRGDTILFSPAFASFGMFKNEFDRGDQFASIVKKLK